MMWFAATGASRTVTVDYLLLVVRPPDLVPFLAVRHIGAYNTPQFCNKYRHAGRRRSSSNRDALQPYIC